MAFVYILRCSDGSYYVGSTRNLENRIWQHSTGAGAVYTSTRLPIELVFAQEYDRVDEAYAREKQIQGWSRKKREALISGAYDELPRLSRKTFGGVSIRAGALLNRRLQPGVGVQPLEEEVDDREVEDDGAEADDREGRRA